MTSGMPRSAACIRVSAPQMPPQIRDHPRRATAAAQHRGLERLPGSRRRLDLIGRPKTCQAMQHLTPRSGSRLAEELGRHLDSLGVDLAHRPFNVPLLRLNQIGQEHVALDPPLLRAGARAAL